MNLLAAHLTKSPWLARVAPFLVFVLLTFLQDQIPDPGRYWLYFIKTLVAAWMLWNVRFIVREMRWAFSWEAVVVGIGVFGLWVGLDPFVPTQQELWTKFGWSKEPSAATSFWNPFAHFSPGSGLGWFFVGVRVLGSSLVVPPLEEILYRSFLYRWIITPDFESVPLGGFAWKPFLIAAIVFGLAHNEWVAAILCAAAYQGLVCRKKRLGDAMTAHAITNFLLGLWIVSRGAWHFW